MTDDAAPPDSEPTRPGQGVSETRDNHARHVQAGVRVDMLGRRVGVVEQRVDVVEVDLARVSAGHAETVRQLAKGITPLVRAHHEVAHRAEEIARDARKSVSDEAVRHDDTTLAIGRYLATAVGGLREAIDENDVRQTRRDAAQEEQLARLRVKLDEREQNQALIRVAREQREAAERVEWQLDRQHARAVRWMQLVVIPIITAALAATGAYLSVHHP